MTNNYMNMRHILLCLCLLTGINASAFNAEIDGICYEIRISDAWVTSGIPYSGNVVIPSSVVYNDRTLSVTRIGRYAFSGCSSLTSVTIPESVVEISDFAFQYCSGLTSITIPESVTGIGASAFYGCSGLTKVIVPNIAAWCATYFYNGASNPLCYAHHLFSDETTEITDLIIPDGVTSIGWVDFGYGGWTFHGCSSLTSVTIPESVTIIEMGAFCDCSGLTSITIPNSVTSIRIYAFANCPELKDVYCYALNVPRTSYETFENSYIENATLHVPAGSLEAYKGTAPWSSFRSIVPLTDEDAIEDVKAAEDAVVVARYDTQGRRISTPLNGLNIIRYSDGTTRKVIMR